MGNVKPIPPHGTSSRYTNQGCRCDECRAARASYAKAWRESNAVRCDQVGQAWRDANKEARSIKRRKDYLTNRDRELASSRDWGSRNRERRAAITASFVARNPDKVRATQSAWRSRNRDKTLRRRRDWNARHRHLVVLYAANRRSLLMLADRRTITVNDWVRLCARYDNRCAYCDNVAPLSQDHVVPLTRGGRHSIGNLLPACKPCNSSKGPRLLIEWRTRRIIL